MKISVVIPLYNKRDTIIRALNSVFRQTIQPEEIIVVNDGSTDGSELIVSELKCPVVKLINQENAGVSAARNRGINESKGDWLAFLDSDDEWMPDFLVTIKSLSEKYPQCSVLATSYLFQDQKGQKKEINLKKIPFQEKDGILYNYFQVASCSDPPICSNSLVLKKSAIKLLGGFPINIDSGEDLLTWSKLACTNDIAYSLKPQTLYYLNPPAKIDKRSSGPPKVDLVALGLNSLKNTCKKHSKSQLKQFIAQWHKMRASIFIRLPNHKIDALK